MSDPNATQPLYDGSTPYVSNTAASVLNLKSDYTMIFSNDKGVVGKLDFNGPALLFTGDVDESAKMFVDAVEKWFAGRMQWVGLTDEILLDISKDAWGRDKIHISRSDHTGFYLDFGRAVEAKLKEKNGG
jgi:hypothetical protein